MILDGNVLLEYIICSSIHTGGTFVPYRHLRSESPMVPYSDAYIERAHNRILEYGLSTFSLASKRQLCNERLFFLVATEFQGTSTPPMPFPFLWGSSCKPIWLFSNKWEIIFCVDLCRPGLVRGPQWTERRNTSFYAYYVCFENICNGHMLYSFGMTR